MKQKIYCSQTLFQTSNISDNVTGISEGQVLKIIVTPF